MNFIQDAQMSHLLTLCIFHSHHCNNTILCILNWWLVSSMFIVFCVGWYRSGNCLVMLAMLWNCSMLSGDTQKIMWIFRGQCATDCMCYTVCLPNNISYCCENTQLHFWIRLMPIKVQWMYISKRVLRSCLKALAYEWVAACLWKIWSIRCVPPLPICPIFFVEISQNVLVFLKNIIGTLYYAQKWQCISWRWPANAWVDSFDHPARVNDQASTAIFQAVLTHIGIQ
jgi:hypothetical protein